jgi:hypothetical protein
MSTLSARQTEFDFPQGEGVPARNDLKDRTPAHTTASVTTMPRIPSFDYPSSVTAAASRRAARINAAAIPDSEHKQLLDERQKLLDKEEAGVITRHELNRLQYVRWSLDRVDDAKYGASLEMLEDAVSRYEKFQVDIDRFHSELQTLRKSRRR